MYFYFCQNTTFACIVINVVHIFSIYNVINLCIFVIFCSFTYIFRSRSMDFPTIGLITFSLQGHRIFTSRIDRRSPIECETLGLGIYGRFRHIDIVFGHSGVWGQGEALDYIWGDIIFGLDPPFGSRCSHQYKLLSIQDCFDRRWYKTHFYV